MEQHVDTPIRIAFGNKSRTGKDTAVEYLRKKYGGVILRFAEPLYDITNHIQKTFSKAVEKDPILLQNVASLCRQHYGEPFADALLTKLDSSDGFCLEHTNVFVVDTRMRHEAGKLRSRGFIMVHIDRPERPIDRNITHISEVDLDNYDWDFRIVNDGTLEQFYTKLDNLVTLVRSKTVAMLATKFLKTVTSYAGDALPLSYDRPKIRPITIDFVHIGDGFITDEVPEDLPTVIMKSNITVVNDYISPRDMELPVDMQELQNEFISVERQSLAKRQQRSANEFIAEDELSYMSQWRHRAAPEDIRRVDELHTKFQEMGFQTRKPLETLGEWGSGLCSNPSDEDNQKIITLD